MWPSRRLRRAAPRDWCNTCETLPLREQPNLITSYCHACMAANVECRVCEVRPSDGPADADFQVAGEPIQVAGTLE